MSNSHPGSFTRSFPLLVVFAAMLLVLQFRPIHDTDIFWQRKLGALMLERGGLITQEPFTSTHANESMLPIAWLSQIIHAKVYEIGSWTLLKQVNAFLFAAAFLLVGAVRSPKTSPLRIALGVALGFTAALPHASLRPQTFAVLCCAVLLSLLRGCWHWVKYPAIAVILVLWQNLHPSVLVAVGILGACWLAALVQRDRQTSIRFAILTLLATVATVATPSGFALFQLSTYNAQISRDLGVAEWLPVWSAATWPASATLCFSLMVVGYLTIRNYRTLPRQDLFVLIALTMLLGLATRFAIFWGLAVVPVVAASIAPWNADPEPIPRPRLPWEFVGITMVLALVLPLMPPPRLFIAYMPFEGIHRLQERVPKGTIYSYPQWGGPLIDAGWPDWKVTHDGRYYLFDLEEWKHYGSEALGQIPVAEIEQRYNPSAFFLHPVAQAALIERLRHANGWEEIHADSVSVVFVRS